MADTLENKENKENGAAQGAGANPESAQQDITISGPLTVDVEAPAWAVELKDVCSKVLEAIAQFNENAENVVKDIIAEAKSVSSYPEQNTAKPMQQLDVKINKKAKYVVAPGRAFHSSISDGLVGEGVEVSGLEPDRLKALIAQGIAIEVTED